MSSFFLIANWCYCKLALSIAHDHNKIPLSLHAGLILTKYVYISHILACTCHDPLGLGCLSDTQTSRDKSQAPP